MKTCINDNMFIKSSHKRAIIDIRSAIILFTKAYADDKLLIITCKNNPIHISIATDCFYFLT